MTNLALATDPRLEDADRFYCDLVRASAAIPAEHRLDFSLRLILLMANQIGARATLEACLAEASRPFL